MNKISIAVLGSCATRDVFNSKFNDDYKNIYECILTQNQASIISIMSEPVAYEQDKIDHLADYGIAEVEMELSRGFLASLVELQPQYLLIDFFGDVHFGIIQLAENQFITNNRWKVKNTSFLKELETKGELHLATHTEEYFKIWKSYIDKLFTFLREQLPNTKIIVHKVKNTDQYLTNENEVKPLSTSGKVMKVDVELYNTLWSQLDNYVIEKYQVAYIDMTQKEYTSFEEHPWGPFYVHYTMDYYTTFLKKLHEIVLINTLKENQFLQEQLQSLRNKRSSNNAIGKILTFLKK